MERTQTRSIQHMNQGRRMLLIAMVALAATVALAFSAGCSCSSTATSSSSASSEAVISTLEPSHEPVESTVENPIDFASLQEQNVDVYAWIYIPDTSVNHPVLQNAFVDNYYLVHDMYGAENGYGAVYSQSMNSRDFKDPVTLIYGHTFEGEGGVTDDMFGSLHNFEDQQFFDEHPTFYIYTPDKVLTYEVVSAYEYDDRHIMNSFDFSNPQVVQDYFNYVTNPDSLVKLVRNDVALQAGRDSIVQLSTCTHPPVDSARYLVTGALVDEQSV